MQYDCRITRNSLNQRLKQFRILSSWRGTISQSKALKALKHKTGGNFDDLMMRWIDLSFSSGWYYLELFSSYTS